MQNIVFSESASLDSITLRPMFSTLYNDSDMINHRLRDPPWLDFLATIPEVPSSVPGATSFT
jgi:hypothetical protein